MTCRSKYHSKKVAVDGIAFDSKKEARRYQELKLLQKARKISCLKCHVPYELIPAQRIDGKVVERACTYVADFQYLEEIKPNEFLIVVEDTKGYKTKDYIIKRKLMLYIHGIRIREI